MPARPQPDLVGQQQRGASLPDAVERQQRVAIRRAHQHLACIPGLARCGDTRAPGRALRLRGVLRAGVLRRVGACQPLGHRMALTEVGDPAGGRAVHHGVAARRTARQHGAERRDASEAGSRRTRGRRSSAGRRPGARGRRCSQIGQRQQAAVLEPVEDDQVELARSCRRTARAPGRRSAPARSAACGRPFPAGAGW